MRYSEFPSPKPPKLVAQSLTGQFAYAIGAIDDLEYCIVVKRELKPNEVIPANVRVSPTASLFTMGAGNWEAV